MDYQLNSIKQSLIHQMSSKGLIEYWGFSKNMVKTINQSYNESGEAYIK